jgi:hypothetical protein
MIVSCHSDSHKAFWEWVDSLMKAVLNDSVVGFATLLERLPGVYPTEIIASLRRLASQKVIDPAVMDMLIQQATDKNSTVIDGRSLLPLPHPLNFEWRFTPDTARSLLNRATELTQAGNELLLLGTPGLATEALTLPIGRRLAFLAENNGVTDRIIALNRATGSPLSITLCAGGLPRRTADAVILDPPWYLDFVRPMFAAAAQACRLGGTVLISLPPDGAKPSAQSDRHFTIGFAERIGLNLIEHSQLSLRYETPFFERNALAANGIYPPSRWRRGDLLVFKKVCESERAPPISSTSRQDWTEVTIDRMRLFIRANNESCYSDEPGLVSLVNGDILPTVSRRDERRRRANIWTSGNRIFWTDSPRLVLEAAISCSGEVIDSGVQHRLWGSVSEREKLARIASELRALAVLEAQEESVAFAATSEWSATWKSSTMNCWSKSANTVSG